MNVVLPLNSGTILNAFLTFMIHKEKTKIAHIKNHTDTKEFSKLYCLFFRFIGKIYLKIHFSYL